MTSSKSVPSEATTAPAQPTPARSRTAKAKPAAGVATQRPARPAAKALASSGKKAVTQAASTPRRRGTATAGATTVVAKAPTAVAAASEKVTPAKVGKVRAKKDALVRDSFTFPVADYERIGLAKRRALALQSEVKKSEVLRAGLTLLCALPDAEFLSALQGVEKLKPGRPKK